MAKKVKKKIRDDLFAFYLGVSLFIIFFVLWLFTADIIEIPEQIEEITPIDNLSASEQIDRVNENHQQLNDESNLDVARVTNNTYYCDKIIDENLKEQCLNEVEGVYEEPEQDTRTEQDLKDESEYSLTIVTSDKTHCENIVNDDLRQECLNLDLELEEEMISDENFESDNEENNGVILIEDEDTYALALEQENEEYCYEIMDADLKQQCLNQFN